MTVTVSKSLEQFAGRVRQVVRSMPEGGRPWRDDDRAWISAVWAVGRFDESLAEFKGRLVEASQAGLVELARLDMVEAVADRLSHSRSETAHPYGYATFHLVRP